MPQPITRRQALLTGSGLAAAAMARPAAAIQPAVAAAPTASPANQSDDGGFQFCLNTSTIRGQGLGIVKEIELASKAGYTGIEPWMRELDDYVQQGGKLSDLRKRLEDAGLKVESAIGFARWIVDDEQQRKQGLEQARRDMDVLKQIGGVRIAAPPVGATREPLTDLLEIAGRYRALLEIGAEIGVVPQLEVWGFSQTLSRLGESTFVTIEAGHPDACLLPDVYHIYKGGSDFAGLEMISGQGIQVFHLNDYPATPVRSEIKDEHRVYPGDGVAPLGQILRTLRDNGSQCVLSLELFNRGYWEQDAETVVRTGLEKMQAAVRAALAD